MKRLIVLASLPFGIMDQNDKPAFMHKFMMFIAQRLMRPMVEDARGHMDLVKHSQLAWTVMRSPSLNDQPSQGSYRIGYLDANTGRSSSRADVATFIIDVLMNDKYIKQMPLISS